MVGQPNDLSESNVPDGEGEVLSMDQGPTEPQVKDIIASEQLSTNLEHALTLEEEVDQSLIEMSSGEVPAVGIEPAVLGNPLYSRITPAAAPPSSAEISNTPTNTHAPEVSVGTSRAGRVIWTPVTRGARRRSFDNTSRAAKKVSGSSGSKDTSRGRTKPLHGLGKTLPSKNPNLRARSISPVISKWRTGPEISDEEGEAGKDDGREEGGDGRDDDYDGDGVDGDGAADGRAIANIQGNMGPIQMFGKDGQRDAQAQERQRAKRARCRHNRNQRKAEEKSSANLNDRIKGLKVQVGAGGDVVADASRKRTTAPPESTTAAKKSRLQDSNLAKSLADYLATGVHELTIDGPRYLNLFKNGAIPISTLRQYARTLRDLHQDIGEGGRFAHPTDVLRNASGLLVLQLDGQDLSTIRQVEVTNAVRGGAEVSPRLLFHSSDVVSLAGQIEVGDGYQCAKCLQPHWPVARTKFVLVTYSEVVAASGFPTSLTLPGAPEYVVNPTAAEECYDTVWVLGGLMSDPAKILKAIYGSYQGSLVICLHLGALAIALGESGQSVWDRLWNLVRVLKHSLRNAHKGVLRLVVVPPLLHLGGNELVLHQQPPRATAKLALAELLDLRKSIDMHNGSLTDAANTPMQSWSKFASARHTEIATDPLNRTYREVTVRVAKSTWVGTNGNLHLSPAAIHNMIRSVASFMQTHAAATW